MQHEKEQLAAVVCLSALITILVVEKEYYKLHRKHRSTVQRIEEIASELAQKIRSADADFDESKHPRKANGQFGKGGGDNSKKSLTIGKNGGILQSSEFSKILIKGKGRYPLATGTQVNKIYNFAGKGTGRPVEIENGLIERFGGSKGQWQHTSGIGYINVDGQIKYAEIHWFQEPSVGIKLPRFKRWAK